MDNFLIDTQENYLFPTSLVKLSDGGFSAIWADAVEEEYDGITSIYYSIYDDKCNKTVNKGIVDDKITGNTYKIGSVGLDDDKFVVAYSYYVLKNGVYKPYTYAKIFNNDGTVYTDKFKIASRVDFSISTYLDHLHFTVGYFNSAYNKITLKIYDEEANKSKSVSIDATDAMKKSSVLLSSELEDGQFAVGWTKYNSTTKTSSVMSKIFDKNLTSDSDEFAVTCNVTNKSTNIPQKILGLQDYFLYLWGATDDKHHGEYQVESKLLKGPEINGECEAPTIIAENLVLNSLDATKLPGNKSYISTWREVNNGKSDIYIELEKPKVQNQTNHNNTEPSNESSYNIFLDYVLPVAGGIAAIATIYFGVSFCKNNGYLCYKGASETVNTASAMMGGNEDHYEKLPLTAPNDGGANVQNYDF